MNEKEKTEIDPEEIWADIMDDETDEFGLKKEFGLVEKDDAE